MKRFKRLGAITSSIRATVVIASGLLLAGQGLAFADSTPFSRIIVFGDSVSDTGNLYEMSGKTQPPSPPYADGRFCNGPIWVEYLADDLGMTGLLEDYAFGGAIAGHDESGIPGVQDQIALYFGGSPVADPEALYVVWAGHNEVFRYLLTGDAGPLSAFVENTVYNIQTLWDAGARHILVGNISDLGKIPMLLGTPVSEFVSGLAVAYNQSLADALNSLAAEGVQTIRMDLFTFNDYLATHQDQFGFSNVTDPGIALYPAEPTGYLFWDTAHMTTEGQHATERFALRCLVDYFSPSQGKGTPPAQVNALNGLVRAGKP